jgi:hypothetical protein
MYENLFGRVRMKKSSLMFMIALGVFLSYGIMAQAQGRPMLGGYKEVSTDDAQVQAAADFAVKAQGEKDEASIKLVSIEHAESQVVAGTNYRLCLKVEVENKDDGTEATQEVQVVVFRNLQRVYSLTSWQAAECGGDKDDK